MPEHAGSSGPGAGEPAGVTAASPPEQGTEQTDAPVREVPAEVRRSDDGLMIEVLRRGNGAVITQGERARMHYVGTFENGEVFDSSRERQPFEFELGAGQVIAGFERGVDGMRVGELRRVTVPPKLGYGERGAAGRIPPNTLLIFEIELLEILPAN
jgi:FKBP-type peptidyl-prolyl cis-trans isomerase